MTLPVWQRQNHPFFDLLVNLFSDDYVGPLRLSGWPGVYTYTAGGQKLRMSSSTGEVRDYIGPFQYLNNVPFEVAHEEGRVTPGNPNGYEYFLRDHLGNIRAVVASNGAGGVLVSQLVDYDPWGLELSGLGSGVSSNRSKFNGKETLAELGGGLLDFGARGHDATIGRWGVVDPMAEVSRRFSPFVYGNNNPVRFIDPDGMMATNSNRGFAYSDGYVNLNSGESTGSQTYDGAYQSGGGNGARTEGPANTNANYSVKSFFSSITNYIRKNVSYYRKHSLEVTSGLRLAMDIEKGAFGGDINAASIRLGKYEYSKDGIEGKKSELDYISKENDKKQATGTISHGIEGGDFIGMGAKKEYTVNSNFQVSGDHTNEIQGALGPFYLKYESKENTGESSLQIGVNASFKGGAGIVIDATIIDVGFKIKLPKK